MIKTLNILFVTMFGLGKMSKIPGTLGSLATIIILYIFFHIINLSSNLILICLIVIFIFAFPAVTIHIKNSENKDPKEVIIDEFIGQSIPIYLYEISHGTEKSSDESIIFYEYSSSMSIVISSIGSSFFPFSSVLNKTFGGLIVISNPSLRI